MAGFALRALGMVFRVFVAARLGPEGMGLYQLILSVYMVFVSLASAGINVAIATVREVTEDGLIKRLTVRPK